MHLPFCLLVLATSGSVWAAPQQQQQPIASGSNPIASASSPVVAQSRDAAVYSDAGGYSGGGSGGYGAPSTGYGAPSAAYGAPSHQQQGGGWSSGGGGAGAPQGGGNNGYYYYYYPVQESKSDLHGPQAAYTATDSYGIDPFGIVAVLAIAGLVIAGLALLFPGWAYVKSDEHVYYRSNDGAGSILGLGKEDYRTLMSLVLAAIEGEDCFEKMMCDAGKLVKKVNKADTFLRLMEDFAPTSVSGNIKKLRTVMKKPDECKNVRCSKKKKQ